VQSMWKYGVKGNAYMILVVKCAGMRLLAVDDNKIRLTDIG
jgi:hypothetical protein